MIGTKKTEHQDLPKPIPFVPVFREISREIDQEHPDSFPGV